MLSAPGHRDHAKDSRVVAAFLPFGLRNAGTPFAIASTPVSVAQPDANARSRRNARASPVTPCRYSDSGWMVGSAVGASGDGSERIRPNPTAAMPSTDTMKLLGRYGERGTRLADAPQVHRHEEERCEDGKCHLMALQRRIAVAAYCAADEIDTAAVRMWSTVTRFVR